MAKTAVAAVLTGALLSVCLGCSSSSPAPSDKAPGPLLGGQTGGENGLNCTPGTALEPMPMDSASELGFSAAQMLTRVAGEQTLDLTWSDGGTTALSLTIAGLGRAGYARACSANELDVSVKLVTQDGALAEAVQAKLFARSLERASSSLELPLASLRGTLSARLTLPPGQDTLAVHLDFADGAASGGIDAIDLSGTEPATSVATF
ncbi:MAG TPA: hypothetical protein VHB79_06420 [Polyangiaceae bacterium]|nr:hypothetical protein [Polyangiaceae bacterium]